MTTHNRRVSLVFWGVVVLGLMSHVVPTPIIVRGGDIWGWGGGAKWGAGGLNETEEYVEFQCVNFDLEYLETRNCSLPVSWSSLWTSSSYSSFSVEPIHVWVGIYITGISNVDPFSNTFWAMGYAWLKFRSCSMVDGLIYTGSTIEFENIYDSTNYKPEINAPALVDYYGPYCDNPEPGWLYYQFFFTDQFSMSFQFKKYPLDSQLLMLEFEDIKYDQSVVIIHPDETSGYHWTVDIPGFEISSLRYSNSSSTYTTSFGYPDDMSYYSHVELGVEIRRKSVFFIAKILPPIIITVGVTVGGIVLDPFRLDARLAIGTGGVLSLIFISMSTGDKLPDSAQVTVADWLCDWCFFLLLLVFAEMILVHQWLKSIENLMMKHSIKDNKKKEHPQPDGTGADSSYTDAQDDIEGVRMTMAKELPIVPEDSTQSQATEKPQEDRKHKKKQIKKLSIRYDVAVAKAKKVDKLVLILVTALGTIGTAVVVLLSSCA
ncbi:hypothetical protein Pelo_10276 [Pelomyxa schiedti]|nr:hypothetical protein Pelo_10276 [Pelomyxa schiedti]